MKMKQKIMIGLLAIMCFVGYTYVQGDVEKNANVEMVQTASVGIEQVEAYKIQDEEYEGAVVSMGGLDGGERITILSALGLVLLYVFSFLKGWRVTPKNMALTILFIAAFYVSPVAGTMVAVAGGFEVEQQVELKKLFDEAGTKHKEAIKTEIEAATKGLMTADTFAEKMKAIGIEEKTIEKLTKALETQGLEIQKFLEKNKPAVKSFGEILNDNVAKFKAVKENGAKAAFSFDLTPEVSKTLVERSAVSGSTMGMRLSEIGQIGYLDPVISSLFRQANVGPNSNGTIYYIDETTATRNADNKAEGAEAPESVQAWTERTLTVKKIMDSIPVTQEAFDDVDFIESEVRRLLGVNMVLKEDSQLYSGTGLTVYLKGVKTSAGAFDATGFTGTVDNANVYDLIAAVKVSIMNGLQSKYNPNFVLLNPIDIFKYKVLKGADGHYVLPPFVSADGTLIMGMRVIESSQVTANEMVVGDSRYGTQYNMGGLTIDVGLVDDQFTKDTLTLKARKRTALLIRTGDETGFKKVADIAAAVADLEQAG